jgi:hypothetical protein
LGKGQTEARLQSGPGTQVERQWTESLQILFFAFGFVFIFLFILWVVRGPRGPPLELHWRNWYTPAFFFVLAVVWTWPAVLSGTDFYVGRHHDAPGTIWFLSQAHQWIGTIDPNSTWPMEARYDRLDSFFLLPLSGLSVWLHPAKIHGLLLWFGIAVSGWSAAYSARLIGASAPWHLLAGLCFIGGGVATTAALEGHVYQLFNPWMPLMSAYWWLACGARGSRNQALVAGGLFVACLLTSAYIGFSASIVVLVLWLHRKAWRNRQSWWALVPVLPSILLYVIGFFGAPTTSLEGDAMAVAVSSATLENMLGASSDIDRASHSLSVGLLPLCLGLACVLPRLGTGRSGWRTWWLLVVVGLVFSMGTHLFLNASAQIVPLPLLILRKLPGISLLDFPLRLAWSVFIALGFMGALAATRLARNGNRRMVFVLLIAICEPFLFSRLPQRQQMQATSAPSSMMEIEGPMLSLYPESLSFGYEYDPDLFFTSLSCLFQVSHHQPIADNCISVDVERQPRSVLGRWVHNRLMEGEAHAVRAALSELGFSGLVVHPDLYSSGDTTRLLAGLESLHSQPFESKDAGLWTLVYPLDGNGQRPSGWTPLPDAVVERWGAQDDPQPLKRLLVGLMPDDEDETYTLTVNEGEKNLGTIPFRDLLQGAFQAIPDGRRYAEWTVPTKGSLELIVHDSQKNVRWSGVFQPASEVDFFFVQLPEGPKPLVPTVISPPLNPMGGLFALLGWVMIVISGLGLFLAMRRK